MLNLTQPLAVLVGSTPPMDKSPTMSFRPSSLRGNTRLSISGTSSPLSLTSPTGTTMGSSRRMASMASCGCASECFVSSPRSKILALISRITGSASYSGTLEPEPSLDEDESDADGIPLHGDANVLLPPMTDKMSDSELILVLYSPMMPSDPAMLLPPELMAAIFEHCLPPTPKAPSALLAPLLVAQVNSRWRTIALSSPSLWTSLALRHPGTKKLLKLWIKRSGHLPLSFDISIPFESFASEYLVVIIPHIPRWRDIRLELPALSLALLESYTGPFPLLESLSITTSTRPPRLDVSQAPRLRSLGLHSHLTKIPIRCPFDQLIAIRLDWLDDARSAVEMLKHCSKLELLVCRAYRRHNEEPVAESEIYTHGALAHMCVEPETFPHLTLPALSRVKIDCKSLSAWTMPRTTDLLRQLVQRSSSPLDSLWLYIKRQTKPRGLQDLLYDNPVKHLRLDFDDFAGLQVLIAILEIERVAPDLKHLEILDRGGREFGPLLRTLAARSKPRRGMLRSFKLHLGAEAGSGLVPTARSIPEPYFTRLCALADGPGGFSVLVTASVGDDPGNFVTLLSTSSAESAWWAVRAVRTFSLSHSDARCVLLPTPTNDRPPRKARLRTSRPALQQLPPRPCQARLPRRLRCSTLCALHASIRLETHSFRRWRSIFSGPVAEPVVDGEDGKCVAWEWGRRR
ncbi:hypothetical protein HMN09_00206200 [Mycena chlorophos]|uniref:F-box domain-containing protein n=1 Tax=Mycena chlorophos TaxID=658473 RepID=A0A8H6TLN4_MYCCL|nr:hypothetical protein HMN09_00206200 [Mycena chlorophos]